MKDEPHSGELDTKAGDAIMHSHNKEAQNKISWNYINFHMIVISTTKSNSRIGLTVQFAMQFYLVPSHPLSTIPYSSSS